MLSVSLVYREFNRNSVEIRHCVGVFAKNSHFSLTKVTLMRTISWFPVCQAKIWSKMGTIDILTTPTQTVNKTCLNLPLCQGGCSLFWRGLDGLKSV